MKRVNKILDYLKLLKKYNTLVIKHELLESMIKDKVFENMLNKINESYETIRLKEENKRLRIKLKEYKTTEKNKK